MEGDEGNDNDDLFGIHKVSSNKRHKKLITKLIVDG